MGLFNRALAAKRTPAAKVVLASIWLMFTSPWARAATCGGNTFTVAPGSYASIQSAVNDIPASLSGDFCVNVDTSIYREQITIKGKNTNGHRIYIQLDPAIFAVDPGTRASVNPPAFSTAAFEVHQASVSIIGFNIVPSATLAYGIKVSSSDVAISSVNVQDAAGKISVAGIVLSSRSAVSCTSVTVKDAYGFYLPGAFMANVSFSTAAALGGGLAAYLDGASSATVTGSFFSAVSGDALRLNNNSVQNTITLSSFTSHATANRWEGAALSMGTASSNTVTWSYISDLSGYGASLSDDARNNAINFSTITADIFWSGAALDVSGFNNSFTGNYIANPSGWAVFLSYPGGSNTFSLNTMTSGGSPETFLIDSSNSNTISKCYIENYAEDSCQGLTSEGEGNTISQSTITSRSAHSYDSYYPSLYLWGSDNYVDQSLVTNSQGTALMLESDYSNNTISRSVMTGNGATGYGLYLHSNSIPVPEGGPVDTHVLNSFIRNPSGDALRMEGGDRNSVTLSTVSGGAAGYSGVHLYETSHTGVWQSFVEGGNPVSIEGSSDTAVGSSMLAATGAGGTGVLLTGGSGSLSLSSDSIKGGAAGAGVFLDTANTGTITLSSDVISGAPYGLNFAAQDPGAVLAISSLTFQNPLPAGTTAINFLGGQFISTFTSINFGSSNIAVNVNAGALATASRITMRNSFGAGSGPAYENDPANYIDWVPLPGLSRPSGAALGISSISWTWASVAGSSGYKIFQASDTALLGTVTAPPFTQVGLSTNSAYGVRVSAVNSNGQGPLSASVTTYTLAIPPAGLAPAGIYITSATIAWELNGNPSATLAQVQRSTDNSVFATLFSSAAVSFTDTGLDVCTTYYFKVRNLNGDAVPAANAWSLGINTHNFPLQPPSGLTARSLPANKIALEWTPSPSLKVVRYLLYYDSGTGSVDYSTPLASLTAEATTYTTGVLISSASYTFALRAEDACGSIDQNTRVLAYAASSASPAAVSASIKLPQSGKKINGNSVTVMAEITAGTISQVRAVEFQYKPSGSAVWTDIPPAETNHPNPDYDPPYFLHWNVTALTSGNYDIRAKAADIYGGKDANPPAITVMIDAMQPDVTETVSGNSVVKAEVINNTINSVVQSGDGTEAWLSQVTIPAGVVTASSATLSLANNPASLPAAQASLNPIGQAIELTLSNAQTTFAAGQTAEISLSYPDTNADGIVDGTSVYASKLLLYSYDAVSAAWVPDLGSTVDTDACKVTGQTHHFSYFALFAPAAVDLSAIRVYPNPFRPDGKDPDKGRSYSSGDPKSGIIFDNLTESVTIKIYTVSGQLVRKLGSASSSGIIRWDARNGEGREIASGLYLAVISGPGSGDVTRKIMVIR